VMVNGLPVIRLFGKTREGKTICAFYDKFLPYFYILPSEERESVGEITKLMKEKFTNDFIRIEIVKKFLPTGFSRKEAEALKITLKDPSKTPELREFFRGKMCVKEVFEADILFKYRFMADFGINGMRWIKVTGSHTKTTTVKFDKTIIADKIEMTEDIDNAPFKYMSLDIEVAGSLENIVSNTSFAQEPIAIISLSFYPGHKGKNTIVLISKHLKNHITGLQKDVQTFSNETEMLNAFLEITDDYDPDIVIGYNANNFDFPYINERLKKLKLPRTLGRCSTKSMFIQKIGENKSRVSISGRIVVDPYWMIKEMIRGGGLTKYFTGLKRYGLGDVSKFFLGEGKVDVAHSEISKFWNGNEEQMTKLVDYSRKDSELVLRLLLEKGFLNKYIGVSMVSGVLLQDSLDSGESTRVEHLLMREFNKANFVLPCKPTGFEIAKREKERETHGLKGALVLDPVIGLHDKCVVYLDFASMYPTIFISYNICPTTIILQNTNVENIEAGEIINTPTETKFVSQKVRQGIIPKTVAMLIGERAKVRNEMPKEKDPSRRRALDAKQEALKRMTNSFYGYTGFIMARVYMLDIANAVTGLGRYHIQKTKEIAEKDTKFRVVYGDTDSLMIKVDTNDVEEAFKTGEQLSELINNKLGGVLRLKVEHVFKSLLILAKKRYAGWSFEKIEGGWKEDITMKGIETVRRDWCDLVGETLSKVLRIILVDQKPSDALAYMKEIIQKLQNNEIEVDKLVITKGVSKRLEDYKGLQPHIALVKKMRQRDVASAPGVGDRIGFVITKGTELMSNRAENPEYVRTHGLKVDSKYYIESQLMPPIERVFESMGIKRSELLGIGRQMQLADMLKNGIKSNGHTLEPLAVADGLVCNKCSKTYRRAPLIGKCVECNGELLFFSGENKSRYMTFQ
jgi:DNA polymerase I